MKIETDDLGPSKGSGTAGPSNETGNVKGADEEHKIIEGAGNKAVESANAGMGNLSNQLQGQ